MRYGWIPSFCQLPSNPQRVTSISCLQEAGIDDQKVFLHLLVSSQSSFLFCFSGVYVRTCVHKRFACSRHLHSSGVCVFPVRQCAWIAIGWLVSLRGSSGSKGMRSGAAEGRAGRCPPATAPSLWASSSERCLGSWEAAPGSWGPDAGRRCLGDASRWRDMCMCMFICVCVCSAGGSQADLFTGN